MTKKAEIHVHHVGRKNPSAAEEHAFAEDLHLEVDKLQEEISKQRAIGEVDPQTQSSYDEVLKQYQAARIAADRPRTA